MLFWSGSCGCEMSESGGDQEGPELEGQRGDSAPGRGEVALVVSGDFLDQAMATEALGDAGKLEGCLRGEEGSQGAVSEPGDIELAA
jgi:hypothetical protein